MDLYDMARMTLDQMEIFLAVAEHLHFTRAAEALHLTQSSVSAAVHNIEAEYGVKLFDRIGRHIEITQAGILLLKEAKKTLAQVDLTEQRLRELNNLQRGEIRIGSSINIGNYWLAQKIYQFKCNYPGINIHCILDNADVISRGTAAGVFDLGLVTTEIKSPLQQCLLQEVIGTNRLQVVVGRSHPWFGRSKIEPRDLLETDWIMREPGSGAQQVFEQALQSWGIDLTQLRVLLVLNSSEMVKTVVETGIVAAALPDLMVSKEIQMSILHPVQIVNRSCKVEQNLEIKQFAWRLRHQHRFQTKLLSTFEQLLRS